MCFFPNWLIFENSGTMYFIYVLYNCLLAQVQALFSLFSWFSMTQFCCSEHTVSHGITGKENVLQKYVFVNQKKRWSDAQTFCRQKHTDLVSVRNPDENQLIKALVPQGTLVFIGLFKEFFRWSDNSSSSFRRWSVGEPDGSGDCVEQTLSDTNTWADQNCAETRPFICQDGELLLHQILIKVTMKRKQRDLVLCISCWLDVEM